ncbi:MAG: hypothetical protein NZ992_07585 [Candidatus Korarchaeum sp.]|nr:hypothetical protein [Candidatus Korarchaeum sp.]MDW8035580.1 hypothetical protein [Candidatus Korarchaeum sp.]
MLPEVIDLLLIPVLVSEVPLRDISDEEAAKIATRIRRILPSLEGVKTVIIPVLYYLNDIFGRMKLDEMTVNSATLVDLMEKRGLKSGVYVLNPYSSNGMIPIPNRIANSTMGIAWAVIPIILFGNKYEVLASYEDYEELDYALDDLASLLSKVYGMQKLKIFPPISIEDLIDLIDSVEEIYENSNFETSAG